MNIRILVAAIVFPTAALLTHMASAETDRPNVLFIAVDDLRPQLACYGKTFMKTPHFDELARRSVLFERAYCMVPTCGASRASLMTGLRPTPNRFVSYTARADKEAPNAVTLNSHFKNNGYTTISLGKIFHFTGDNVAGWSEKPWRPTTSDYQDGAAERKAIADHKAKYPQRTKVRGFAYEAAEVPDANYRDHQSASKAIEYLEEFQDSDSPFFLAVGFFKPHLPFCAPKRYWDLYDFDSIDLPSNYGPPKGAPQGAVHTSGELRAYAGIPPKGPVDREQARHLIHGYYACVSFIDAQLGRLLAALDETGLAENTIVVLWGDHGWQLGEHGMWNKHSCFETSMHTPLFVSAPRDLAGALGINPGSRTPALTEFIDIYPSLCELTGIETPKHVEGKSFVPLMKDPSKEGKPHAVGRFTVGDTIRTDMYRYSEYRDRRGAGQLTGKMLYDHRTDPDENTNVVKAPSNASTVTALSDDLNATKGK
jgi:arylsulfatase A-like enzyme